MHRSLNRYGSKLKFHVVGTVLGGLVCGLSAQAEEQITLLNPSFEAPAVPELPAEPSQVDFIKIDIDDWDETGLNKSLPDFGLEGLLDTGVFKNDPVEVAPGLTLPPIAGGDGGQIGFLRIDPNARTTGPNTTVSQTVLQAVAGDIALFEPGYKYSFTVAVGASLGDLLNVLQTSEPGWDPTNPERIELVIGYGGEGTADFTEELGVLAISAFDLEIDTDTLPAPLVLTPLNDFTVMTDVLGVGDTAIGEEVRVMIRQATTGPTGTGGTFNFDNARLTRAVPEPTSLTLLALSAGLLARRRRKA